MATLVSAIYSLICLLTVIEGISVETVDQALMKIRNVIEEVCCIYKLEKLLVPSFFVSFLPYRIMYFLEVTYICSCRFF